MQHDPDYEHWEERIPALENMVDRHTIKIDNLDTEIVRLREAVLELIKMLKDLEKEGEQ